MLRVKLSVSIDCGYCEYHVLECSNCHEKLFESYAYDNPIIPKFCPQCGTKLWSIE